MSFLECLVVVVVHVVVVVVVAYVVGFVVRVARVRADGVFGIPGIELRGSSDSIGLVAGS